MNEYSWYLEILAVVFGLGGLAVLSVTMITSYRFTKATYANKSIDPKVARWIILGMFAFGVCVALAGLSLSLWSPAGLERLTFREVLFSFLLCGGGGALLGVFLVIMTWWKMVLRRKWGIDTERKWKAMSRNRQVEK